MRRAALLVLGLVTVSLLTGNPVAAFNRSVREVPLFPPEHVPQRVVPSARAETLWIFDADFNDLVGDNDGWVSLDRSGTLEQVNYWHHDTIRINGFAWLGDSTWWCGTYDDCWLQPRGYGNDWVQILERSFPEIASSTSPGDLVQLTWDQRLAMENDYDYGYVDASLDDGVTWTNLYSVNNTGFVGKPGYSADWDDPTYGHVALDLSSYAGQDISIRFRFESDCCYSSQDQLNNPPQNSCEDGAWQLDNITLLRDGADTLFYDDAESGVAGWVRPAQVASGQTGVTFRRGVYGVDFVTGRGFMCGEGQGWMYAAVDQFTGKMVDGQEAWLISPPIDISGAEGVVGAWDMWVDMPLDSRDVCDLRIAAGDDADCIAAAEYFEDEEPGWWFGGPFWGSWTDQWDRYAGNDWLSVAWVAANTDVATGDHMAGIFLERQRVGAVLDDPETHMSLDAWDSFHDWFDHDLLDAQSDAATVYATDRDGVESVRLVASADGGATWESYDCENLWGDTWEAPPPADQLTSGCEVVYYFEAADSLGNTTTYPRGAPDARLEMSILPITGSIAEPGILVVDSYRFLIPGEQRDYAHSAEYYYREALDELGLAYDVYDVPVPGATDEGLGEGPDLAAMAHYDTQIWLTSSLDVQTLTRNDQANLIDWLSQSVLGDHRNLLVTGDNIGFDLIESGGETLSFYGDWLGSAYVRDTVGIATVDSLPGIAEHHGGSTFVLFPDDLLRGGCPHLGRFDVVAAAPGAVGAETAAVYVRDDGQRAPAGVARTDPGLGYRTVNLGFGVESISGQLLPGGGFVNGASRRADVLRNIMLYFGKVESPVATPIVKAIEDVGNDEGRQVRVRWTRSSCDGPGFDPSVVSYALYRREDGVRRAGCGVPSAASSNSWSDAGECHGAASPFGRWDQGGLRLEGWDYLMSTPACGDDGYQVVAPTLCDSTADGGVCWSVFLVRAMTTDNWLYFDSPPDSGYSVDNLAPNVPGGLRVEYNPTQGNHLTWRPSAAADFRYFRVYRDQDVGFEPGPDNLAHATIDTCWTDPGIQGWLYCYKVTAVDHAGNESAPAAWDDLPVPVEDALVAGELPGGGVALTWSLQALPDVERMEVRRSTSRDTGYSVVEAGSIQPSATGRFEDRAVWPETTFWYELHGVEPAGSSARLAGPVSVVTGGQLRLALHDPSPNPSKGDARIRFDLPAAAGDLRVTVYNVRGQVVRQVARGPFERGRHEVLWDGRDSRQARVASGVYLVRLDCGLGSRVGKLIRIH
jgi:hypothetical protein